MPQSYDSLSVCAAKILKEHGLDIYSADILYYSRDHLDHVSLAVVWRNPAYTDWRSLSSVRLELIDLYLIMEWRPLLVKITYLHIYACVFVAWGIFEVSSQQSVCPNRCVCFGTTVRCMFNNLETIPEVSPDTKILWVTEAGPQAFAYLRKW